MKSAYAMTLAQLRDEYTFLRRNSGISATVEEWTEEVEMLAIEITANEDGNPTPADWVNAARVATTVCDKCKGTGVYHWGGTLNGKPVNTGECYRCLGKGRQNQEDYRRNYGHTMYAISSAYREMVGSDSGDGNEGDAGGYREYDRPDYDQTECVHPAELAEAGYRGE